LLDPSILILDDPTAAVDSQTEHEILAAMEAAMRGRTTFLVTHRISALRRADRILVLERGRIVQAGTHAALMAARGPYQRLVMLQGGDDEGDGPALPATAPQGGPLP
jgi:ATP-binding cassette subfamily B protein